MKIHMFEIKQHEKVTTSEFEARNTVNILIIHNPNFFIVFFSLKDSSLNIIKSFIK